MAAKDDGTEGLGVFDEALGSIQTTAKWIVGAAAVIIGTLISGLQLKDLASLLPASRLQLGIAIAACVVAIAGVGVILVRAARVLITHVTLSDIALEEVRILLARDLKPGQDVSDFNPMLKSLAKRRGELLPDGIPDVLTFKNAYEEASQAAARLRNGKPVTLSGVSYSPSDPKAKEQLEALVSDYQIHAVRLVDAAQLYLAQRAFKRLIKALWAYGSLALAGVIIFIISTAKASSSAPVTSPAQVVVLIAEHPSHADLLAAGLAQGCVGRTLTGVAIGGSYDQPLVVTKPAPSCPARQFKVTRGLGLAIPVVPTPEPTCDCSPSLSPTPPPTLPGQAAGLPVRNWGWPTA